MPKCETEISDVVDERGEEQPSVCKATVKKKLIPNGQIVTGRSVVARSNGGSF